MRRLTSALALALAACALLACGDNKQPPPAANGDAGVDASPQALAPCLERPTDVPRAPNGPLPCELLPPGFSPPKQP